MRVRVGFSRSFVFAAFAAVCLAAPAAAQTSAVGSSAAQPAAIHQAPAIQIGNFAQVSNTYFRGSQPEGHDYADLAAAGVKTVINLESDDAQANEGAMVKAAGMHYVQIPMTTHVAPTSAQIAQFLSVIDNAANQPVYVHCVGGRHRTGVMTAVYRMTDDGWSGTQAFSEMKQFKFGMDFLHPEFKAFVLGYHPVVAAHAAAAATAPAPVDAKHIGG